jgi:CRISPR-associated protein Cst2
MTEEVYEIAILARATWNLHSLSNEGTVGNVTEPRTVMLADGTPTDGISGEMLKHIHAGYVWALQSNKSELCDACKNFWPERAGGNPNVKGKSIEEAVKEALKCELCDLHGFLVPLAPNPNRASTIEFGWAVGIPTRVQRGIHVHTRHALHEARLAVEEQKEPSKWGDDNCFWERREEGNIVEKCTTNPNESMLYKVKGKWYCEEHVPGAVTPQMLYHRPTRSGVYAIISVFQPWRIGLNNIKPSYNLEDEKRKLRYKLALKAYQAMFLRTEGAMTTTRLPHTENFEGVIVVSRVNYPAPVISPLKDDYAQEIENIKTSIGDNKIEVKNFTSLAEYVQKINELIEDIPYKVQI